VLDAAERAADGAEIAVGALEQARQAWWASSARTSPSGAGRGWRGWTRRVQAYVHMGGKVGVLVAVSTADAGGGRAPRGGGVRGERRHAGGRDGAALRRRSEVPDA
jgi:hypothetical protein